MGCSFSSTAAKEKILGTKSVLLFDAIADNQLGAVSRLIYIGGVNVLAKDEDGCTAEQVARNKLEAGKKRMWVSSWSNVATLAAHESKVNAVAWFPDGRYLVSGSSDMECKIWDKSTGHVTSTLRGHEGWVFGVAVAPDGKGMASCSRDSTVRLWDPATSQCSSVLTGHLADVNSTAYSPVDSHILASCGDDNTVRLWDTRARGCQATMTGHSQAWDSHSTTAGVAAWVMCVAWSPDGRQLASAGRDNTVQLWDPSSRQATGTCRGHTDDVNCVAFSPDGSFLASGSDDTTVKLWDPQTQKCKATLGIARDRTRTVVTPAPGDLPGHTDDVTSLCWSPDGAALATGSSDCAIRLWDMTGNTLLDTADVTHKCHTTLKGHESLVMSVAFSPEGHMLASASTDHKVKLWSPESITIPERVLAAVSRAAREQREELATKSRNITS